MSADSLMALYEGLRVDRLRESRPFSQDIKEANDLLHYPYALDQDLVEAMRQWCMKRQPCQFGRLAASKRQIHFCFLREIDLARDEKGIAEKISESKRLWKQRGIIDATPPHGFMLVFASPKVALAAPDDNLRRFSDKILELAGWGPERRGRKRGNTISSDFLYLKSPADGLFYGFQFNVDFFAAAGDGRWWHDHRIPGGIAFTANSTGHMRHFKDWYGQPGSDHGEWAVKQAMITIAQAHPTTAVRGGSPQADGRVTWLRDLDAKGKPLLAQVPCPMVNVPGQLQGKDWTRYEGVLHTDHAVRAEFFADRDEPVTADQPYLMDFTYLYENAQADFVNFMAGVRTSEEEVYADTGRPDTWGTRDPVAAPDIRTGEQVTTVKQLLRVCQGWEPSADYLSPELPT
jgi:hypothetical protein